MLVDFFPYEYLGSVFQIDYEKLYANGVRGLIFDIDNTLVHHGADSTPEIDRLLSYINSIGFKVLLLTNNSEERTLRFLKNIDALYLCEADKPNPRGFEEAVKMLGFEKKQIVYVGDQIFVDTLGANKCSIPNILVHFIQLDPKARIGKKRYIEKVILFFYRRSKKYSHRLGNIRKRG